MQPTGEVGGGEAGEGEIGQVLFARPAGESVAAAVHQVVVAGVADRVEGAHELVPGDVAVAHRHEIPAAARVAEREVRGEDRVASVQVDLRVLHVDVDDPVLELEDELRRVEELNRLTVIQ